MHSSLWKTLRPYEASFGIVQYSNLCRVSFSTCRAAPWQRKILPERAEDLACFFFTQKSGDHALRIRGLARLDKCNRLSKKDLQAFQISVNAHYRGSSCASLLHSIDLPRWGGPLCERKTDSLKLYPERQCFTIEQGHYRCRHCALHSKNGTASWLFGERRCSCISCKGKRAARSQTWMGCSAAQAGWRIQRQALNAAFLDFSFDNKKAFCCALTTQWS